MNDLRERLKVAGIFVVHVGGLEDFHKEVVNRITENFNDHVQIEPQWFMWKPFGSKIIHIKTLFDSDEEKEFTSYLMRVYMSALDIRYYCAVMEAWMVDLRGSGVTKIPRSLKDHPDRKEILMFSSESENAAQSTTFDIVRKGWKRELLNRYDTDVPAESGRFVGLLKKGVTK